MTMTWLPHYLPEGTVYGVLLNFQRETALWADRMNQDPYKAPPKAPVLYVKTANTFSPSGHDVELAADVAEVEVGATVGLIMGEPGQGPVACALFSDFAVPHESYFRPPVKFRCRDGFLGVGRDAIALADVGGLEGLQKHQLEVRVDGVLRQTVQLGDMVREASVLLADVAEFMTLQRGDVLLLGSDCLADGSRPRAKVGDTVEVSAAGFKPVVTHFVAEEEVTA